MDHNRFDSLVRRAAIAADRRGVLRAAVAGALGLAGLRGEGVDAACRQPQEKCTKRTQCCSGICRGKKCRKAENQGTCTIAKDTCRITGGIGFGPKCNGVQGCECIQTKSGAAFCREIGGAACTSCASDQQCIVAFGLGAKCISGARCGDPCGIGDFCAVPCGFDSARRRDEATAKGGD